MTYVVQTPSGLGEVSADWKGLTAKAMIELHADAGAMAALGPTSNAIATVLGAIGDVGGGGGLPAHVVDAVFGAMFDAMTSAMGTVGVEMATTVLDTIPMFGQLLSSVVSVVAGAASAQSASGTGPASADRETRTQWCRATYAPVRGSGFQGRVYPADVFAPQGSRNGFNEPCRSSLGEDLVLLLESDPAPYVQQARLLAAAGVHVPEADALIQPWLAPNAGIAAPRRRLYKLLREAIQASWRQDGSRGGADIWPIYMDLALSDWNAGRISYGMLKSMEAGAWSGSIAPAVADPDERVWGCFAHESRGFQMAVATIKSWGYRWYVQDKEEIAASQAMVAEAKRRLKLARVFDLSPSNVTLSKAAAQGASTKTSQAAPSPRDPTPRGGVAKASGGAWLAGGLFLAAAAAGGVAYLRKHPEVRAKIRAKLSRKP